MLRSRMIQCLPLALCAFVAVSTQASIRVPIVHEPPQRIFSIKSEHHREHYPLRHRSTRLKSSRGAGALTTQMSFGSQTFNMLVDTGSSDLWLANTSFRCFKGNGSEMLQADCRIGSLYDYENDPFFIEIPNENFLASYGDGAVVSGIVGNVEVTLADTTVKNQEIGVVNKITSFALDGEMSGLLGLGYSLATGAFSGTNVSADGQENHKVYDALVASIFARPHMPAMFSLAVSRDDSGSGNAGVLTIGGIPSLHDPTINVTAGFASTPIEAEVDQIIDAATPELQQYAVTVQGLYYGSLGRIQTNNTADQYIVDSGTTNNVIPAQDAVKFNALFDPPAILVNGAFQVQCNSSAPSFTYMIGGKPFHMNSKDLILYQLEDELCLSSMQSSPAPPYILGIPFHKSVLAVYDWGNNQMHFAAREYYES